MTETCINVGDTAEWNGVKFVCSTATEDPPEETVMTTCRHWLNAGRKISGTYKIDPDGNGSVKPFNVYCDMNTQGGGWTLVGKHKDWLPSLAFIGQVTPADIVDDPTNDNKPAATVVKDSETLEPEPITVDEIVEPAPETPPTENTVEVEMTPNELRKEAA